MAAPQQNNPSDNSAGILWGIAALFAGLGAVWIVFKNQIVSIYLSIKLYELNLLSAVSNYLNIDNHYFEQLRSIILNAQASPATIRFPDLIHIGTNVGDWLRYPLIFLLLILAVVVYLGNTTRVFKHNYSMQDLAKLEKGNWPQIAPVIGLDLINTDIDTGPWAMAMTPMQFCKRYKLLEEIRPERREGMSRRDWDRVEVVLKRGEASKLFALQLGVLWKGTANLPPHARALFAIFAARIHADGKEAAKLLSQLSLSSTHKLDLTGVEALLKKYENTKPVQQVIASHAYVLTVMAAMLEAAREDGVQASADFLWLKPMDRRLWYTLNTVGRQTPFIEVAGIFAHWTAEKEAGRKLLMPMIEEATNALELALKDVIYRPDEA